MLSRILLAACLTTSFALVPTAAQAKDEVVVNKKNYAVTKTEVGGKTRFTWVTKDGDRGMSATKKGAKKAAKNALKEAKNK